MLQTLFVEPLLGLSTGVTTQLRRAGFLPQAGINPEYGGKPEIPSRGDITGKYIPGSRQSRWSVSSVAENKPTSSPNVFSTMESPAQRAEQQERSRIAQMTEQDPLFKKYQVADLTKAYNAAATPEEKERIGLQIWATTNPQLAQKLKPGQVGYQEATSSFASQSPLGKFQQATGGMEYADKLSQITGAPSGFQVQTPLTNVQIPPTDQIGVTERFASSAPAPGAVEAFTDPMKMFGPEKLGQTQLALLKQAFASRLK